MENAWEWGKTETTISLLSIFEPDFRTRGHTAKRAVPFQWWNNRDLSQRSSKMLLDRQNSEKLLASAFFEPFLLFDRPPLETIWTRQRWWKSNLYTGPTYDHLLFNTENSSRKRFNSLTAKILLSETCQKWAEEGRKKKWLQALIPFLFFLFPAQLTFRVPFTTVWEPGTG